MKSISIIAGLSVFAAVALIAPAAPSQEKMPDFFARHVEQADDGTCLCNEDFTSCICCETVATPPFIACDIVLDGEEVTGPASADLTIRTDGKGGVKIERSDIQLYE